ncbi:MAG TPA: ATP-binding cassette domain-containing protein [Gemmatimonadales bacterium]|nr:ATP-binding cassette domain-containing protein [Gemmatimonadales bacterium]
MTGRALLSIEDLRLCYDGRDVLRGVSLEVRRGEVLALMGLSGAGKTSALRAVAALQAFDAGRIEVDGIALEPGRVPPQSRLQPLRRRVGLVFQGHALFDHLCVIDNVTLALTHVLGQTEADAQRAAHALLSALGVEARANALPARLSGGEAQRVAIARALAPNPPLLLMDEPTAALDPARRSSLGQTMRRLAAEGRGLLVATHDAAFARAHADRVAILAQGVVVEAGDPGDVLERPRHQATRALLAAEG